jgi:replicative DNA helicase
VLALSQLNRAVEGRDGRKPQLSDLRESGAIEQDADLVMLLYREDYYHPDKNPGVVEVNVAKQRNGPTGIVQLVFLKNLLRFENYTSDAPRVPEEAPF